jgi:hypothetical protein
LPYARGWLLVVLALVVYDGRFIVEIPGVCPAGVIYHIDIDIDNITITITTPPRI